MESFMKKAINTIRWYLRKLFVIFGIVSSAICSCSMYGMPSPDPIETSVRGTVRSLKTGDPIKGIEVYVKADAYTNRNFNTNTDDNGDFYILMPEKESYDFRFVDVNGEQNGGFFKSKDIIISLAETKNILNIELEKEVE